MEFLLTANVVTLKQIFTSVCAMTQFELAHSAHLHTQRFINNREFKLEANACVKTFDISR